MPIETVVLDALDGAQLQADLVRVDNPVGSVVVTHPHPLYGGDRFNPVVEAVFRAAPAAGLNVIRFDFRGVNDSTGVHDDGEAERLDVVAAIELIEIAAPDVPIWLVGYSFGSIVALDVIDPRVAGWVAIAPPLAARSGARLAGTDHRRKLLLVPAHDQFSPPPATSDLTASWRNTDIVVVDSADHFLAGRTGTVAQAAIEEITGRTRAGA